MAWTLDSRSMLPPQCCYGLGLDRQQAPNLGESGFAAKPVEPKATPGFSPDYWASRIQAAHGFRCAEDAPVEIATEASRTRSPGATSLYPAIVYQVKENERPPLKEVRFAN